MLTVKELIKRVDHVSQAAFIGLIEQFEEDERTPVRFNIINQVVIPRDGEEVILIASDELIPKQFKNCPTYKFNTAQQLTSWLDKFGVFKDKNVRIVLYNSGILSIAEFAYTNMRRTGENPVVLLMNGNKIE